MPDACRKGASFFWRWPSGKTAPFRCRSLRCPDCAPTEARRLADKLGSWAEALKLTRFWTFTLDPKMLPELTTTEARVKYLRKLWNKFLTALRRDNPGLKLITVLEFHKSGWPHLHVLLDRYLKWDRVQKRWHRYGGGQHVHVKYVDVHRVAAYLSKYLTDPAKLDSQGDIDGTDGGRSLLFWDWPKKARHHTSSRCIHLAFMVEQWEEAQAIFSACCFRFPPGDENCRTCPARRLGCGDYERATLCGPLGPINAPKLGPPEVRRQLRSLARAFWRMAYTINGQLYTLAGIPPLLSETPGWQLPPLPGRSAERWRETSASC